MAIAYFRFYEELNDFLPDERKKVLFPFAFSGNPSVKFAVEALGVPHTEIDMILVNSHSVDFTYKLQQGDTVSVYPVFESLYIGSVTHLREKPLRNVRFITDVHLGRLAKYLRLFGFDTLYKNDFSDRDIMDFAESDKRTILTRDRELFKNNRVTRGYWIRSQHPREQLKEVIDRLDLKKAAQPFTRCMECNALLEAVDKESILSELEPGTRKGYDEFRRCAGCGKIYWKGSHHEKMSGFIEETISL
ncbi:MAG: Mut7-C ubiquitin/RNAse domain-containing protein [Bacteroidales bacterium]|nr:Mut7-C ubiquitin/RNAse domain-containing protein [Bacteroidales bacterium]